MFRLVIRLLLCYAVALVCWVGSAQLGMALLGPQNPAIILVAVVGLFAGVGGASRLWRAGFWGIKE